MITLSEANSINSILGIDENSFEVPLYQRRYVWDQTNLKTLWDDMLTLNRVPPAERGTGHFIGPIVTRFIGEGNDSGQKRYEVIDGQQRLTTLEIIFCVIKDLCSGLTCLKNKAVIESAERHVVDKSANQNHKLILTRYDKLTFEKIVSGEYGEKIHNAFDTEKNELQREGVKKIISQVFGQSIVSSNILDAYKYFYEQVRIHVKEDPHKVADLLSTITTDFKLIHLGLSDTEQAEKVFESINATGRKLSNFDYLRNNLFLRARKLGKNEKGKFYRDVFYNDPEYWPFEKNWDAKKQESFLRAFLGAIWNPKCLEEENAKAFEEYLKYSNSLEETLPDDCERIRYEFSQLGQWAASYQELQDDENFNSYECFCKDLSLPDLNSFLLFVKHVNADVLSDVVWIWQSYIVRRMFVLENTTYQHAQIKMDSYVKIEDFFSSVVKNFIIDKDFIFNIKSFANFLNETCLNDRAVIDAFRQARTKNTDFLRYMFRQIKDWDEENTRMYNLRPLNWGEDLHLAAQIQERLKNPNKLNQVFNDLWPPLSYFLQF